MECSPSDSPRNKLSKTPLKVNEIILKTHVIGWWKNNIQLPPSASNLFEKPFAGGGNMDDQNREELERTCTISVRKL